MTLPASLALRGAIINALKADAGVAGYVASRIYDFVPEREAFPYISFRESAKPFDTTTTRGKEHTVTLNVWSQKEGRKEVDLILGEIELVLRAYTALVLSDHTLTNLEFQMMEAGLEDGGKRYFGIARFRVVTEEI